MADLTQHIQQQTDQLHQLTALLESELHLISTRDADALIKVVEQKQVLLEQIHQSDSLIEQAYTALDDEQKQDPALQALFDQAKSQVKECQYRTEINQKAVEQGQLRLEHLRNLLLEARAKENLTYDKSGKTNALAGGKGVSA